MWSGFIIRQSWTNDLLGIECENFYCLVKGTDVTFQSAIYPSSQVLFGVLIELIFIFRAIFLKSKRLLKVFWA